MDTLANDNARLAADVALLKKNNAAIAQYIADQKTEIASLKAAGTVDTSGLETNLAALEAELAASPVPPESSAPAATA